MSTQEEEGPVRQGEKGTDLPIFCTGKLGFESLVLEITNKNIGVGLLFGKHIARGMGFDQGNWIIPYPAPTSGLSKNDEFEEFLILISCY